MIAYHEFQHVIKNEKKIIETNNQYKTENYSNYSKESDTPIYTKALYNDYVNSIELWDEGEDPYNDEQTESE